VYVDVSGHPQDWQAHYRLCIGLVTPRPIALVSTICPNGHHNLAPFSFFNMVSANPPVLMFCPALRRDRREKDTLINVEAVRQFVIAIVDEPLGRQMAACAADLPYGESEFEFAGLTPARAAKVRAPLVQEAPVNFECSLRQVVRMGDRPGASAVVFGDILAVHLRDDLLDESGQSIDPRKLRSIGRLGGAWYCTVTEPYEIPIPKAGGGG